MRLRLVTLMVMLPFMATAQTQPDRPFRDGKLISKTAPPVTLEPGKAFHYAGGQVIDIFKVAGAEQHFFVDAPPTVPFVAFIGFSSSSTIPPTRTSTITPISNSSRFNSAHLTLWVTSKLPPATLPTTISPAQTPRLASSSCTPGATNWTAPSSVCGSSTYRMPLDAKS